jgi:ABC-type nitrate/sulfonate/bicarbonate transport system substrate-binding protein
VAVYPSAGFIGGLVSNSGLKHSASSAFSSRYGVRAEFIIAEDIGECLRLFRNNDADIIWSAPEILAYHYGEISYLNPAAFMQYCRSAGDEIIAAGRTITSMSMLAGKHMAIVNGSSSHMFALFMAGINGVRAPDGIDFIKTFSGTDSAALFAGGRAESCAVNYICLPNSAAASDHDVLYTSADAPGLISGVFVAKESFIIKNPGLLENFARGWFEGAAAARKNPDRAAAILSKCFGFDLKKSARLLKLVYISDYSDNAEFFEIAGGSLNGFNDIFKRSSAIWRSQGRDIPSVTANMVKNTAILVNISESYKIRPTGNGAGDFSPNDFSADKPVIRRLTGKIPVYFGRDSAEINYNAANKLAEIAGLAAILGSSYIYLYGCADPDAEKAAAYLSKTRAENLRSFLMKKYEFPRQRFRDREIEPKNMTGDRKRVDVRFVSVKARG